MADARKGIKRKESDERKTSEWEDSNRERKERK